MEERSDSDLLDIAKQVRDLTNSPSSNKISWSDGTLDWDNFKGKIPDDRGEHTAELHSYMEPTWNIKILDRESASFTYSSISAVTISHKDASWVIDDGKCDQALRHEQGHFDITEMYTRLFNKQAQDMIGKTFKAQNSDSLILEAELQIIRLWDFVNRKRIEHQCKYESETDHGTKNDIQSEYETDIQNGLNSI